MTITPFTFADNVCSSMIDIFDESNAEQYVPFIINRHLSHFIDLVLYANDMNIYNFLPKSTQYQYLLNTIPKRKRFSKWEKKSSDVAIEAISRRFLCNRQRAEEMSLLLSDSVKAQIITEVGMDNDSNSKPRRGNAKGTR